MGGKVLTENIIEEKEKKKEKSYESPKEEKLLTSSINPPALIPIISISKLSDTDTKRELPLLDGNRIELRILLISDTHGDLHKIQKLGSWFSKTQIKYDLILMAGDFYFFHDPRKRNWEAEKQAEKILIQTLNYIENIGKCPIIYVPGNHDPLKEYSREIETKNTYNIHKTSIKILDDLVIFGIGGSIPTLKYVDNVLFAKSVPFPYKNDEQFERDARHLFENTLTKYKESATLILLTHIGSYNSQTAINKKGNKTSLGGSKALEKLILENNERICLHVHGHHHENALKKYDRMNGIPIVNPGALTENHFGEIAISKTENTWKLGMYNDLQIN